MISDEITKALYALDLGSSNAREVLIAMWFEIGALEKQLQDLQNQYQSHCHLSYGGETSPPKQSALSTD